MKQIKQLLQLTKGNNNNVMHTKEIFRITEWTSDNMKTFSEQILQNEANKIYFDRYSYMSDNARREIDRYFRMDKISHNDLTNT